MAGFAANAAAGAMGGALMQGLLGQPGSSGGKGKSKSKSKGSSVDEDDDDEEDEVIWGPRRPATARARQSDARPCIAFDRTRRRRRTSPWPLRLLPLPLPPRLPGWAVCLACPRAIPRCTPICWHRA